MKPEAPISSVVPEQVTVHGEFSIEQQKRPDNALESTIDSGAERYEKTADLGAIRNDVGLASAIPTPVVISNNIDDTITTPNNNPFIANDDDLMEKEWVDRAKSIVAQTKDNPHLQEKEVSKLQVDYIKKRFGRELGVVD